MRNNPNGQRHISDVSRSKHESLQLAKSTAKLLTQNYSRRELVKIFYMIWEGREITFSPYSCISTSKPADEQRLPTPLKVLLKSLYPPKEMPDPDDARDGDL